MELIIGLDVLDLKFKLDCTKVERYNIMTHRVNLCSQTNRIYHEVAFKLPATSGNRSTDYIWDMCITNVSS